MQVPPALCRSPQAEVVFLPVPVPETVGVEVAHLVQARAADVHAKAYRRGNVDRLSAVGVGSRLVQAAGVFSHRERVVHAKDGIAADGCVVGKRRHCSHRGVRKRRRTQPVQPVIGNFGVAVQQDNVATPRQPHPEVHRLHEAEIANVLDHRDAGIGRGEFAQPGTDRGVRAAVVDQREMPLAVGSAALDRPDAALHERQVAVDRHDDFHSRIKPAAVHCAAKLAADRRSHSLPCAAQHVFARSP
ncbi:MAG: hypothetical protein NVS3B2_06850 [Ramlibacter sp.]